MRSGSLHSSKTRFHEYSAVFEPFLQVTSVLGCRQLFVSLHQLSGIPVLQTLISSQYPAERNTSVYCHLTLSSLAPTDKSQQLEVIH